MDTQISNSFQNKTIPINLYPMDTYLDVVRPQTRSALSVVRLFPGGRSGFHFHWLSENIKKKKMLNTQMFEISHDYCMLLKRGISNLDDTEREKKALIVK